MTTVAQFASWRDRLTAIIDEVPVAAPPVIIPAGEPPLSAMAIEAGFTQTVFFDHFDDPATIDWDSKLTMEPPHKWASWYYSDAHVGTMANSVLRIDRDPGNGGGNCLATMCVNPAGKIVGWGYKGAAEISCAMRCDPSTARPGYRTWPAFWSLAKEHVEIGFEQKAHQSCARADGSWPRHMELDYVEPGWPFPTSLLFAVNYWECNLNLSRKYEQCDWNGVIMGGDPNAYSRPDGFDARELNIFTTIKKIGSLQRYITRPGGQPFHVPELDQSWEPDDPYWALIDSQTYPLIVGAGADFPGDFDWVCVRQSARAFSG